MTEGTRWDAPQTRHFDVPDPESPLTHFGSRLKDGTWKFIDMPKWRSASNDPYVEVDVSMLLGKLTIDEASMRIRRMSVPDREKRKQAVRYFITGKLLENGYYVLQTPSPHNPDHVSVYGNMDEIDAAIPAGQPVLISEDAHRAWWTHPERVKLSTLEIERRCRDDE
ncbi:hypothetical protein [Rhodococcus baikonurensis]|uniref:Uncharacterized protein n=1 Tax=Rhodococcus baikonurensis TaxID=172041 RepID=A0ABV5XKT6_9NOCA